MSVDVTSPLDDWTDHLTCDSEQIDAYRELGDGGIVVPELDSHTNTGGGYAKRSAGGAWSDNADAFSAEHVFDMREFNGDLWACGADPGGASVWRSTNGGTTWSQSLLGPRGDFNRFYVLVVAGTPAKLRVRDPVGGNAYVWTGVAWIDDGTKPLPDNTPGAAGQTWGTAYVTPDNIPPFGSGIIYFDGTSTQALPGFASSVADDGNLYVLTSEKARIIRYAPDLTSSLVVRLTPNGGAERCSLCVLPGSTQALLGRTTSRLELIDLI